MMAEITRNGSNLPKDFVGLVDRVKVHSAHFIDFRRKPNDDLFRYQGHLSE